MYNGKLQICDDEYSAFFTAAENTYSYCPICGENLKKEFENEKYHNDNHNDTHNSND